MWFINKHQRGGVTDLCIPWKTPWYATAEHLKTIEHRGRFPLYTWNKMFHGYLGAPLGQVEHPCVSFHNALYKSFSRFPRLPPLWSTIDPHGTHEHWKSSKGHHMLSRGKSIFPGLHGASTGLHIDTQNMEKSNLENPWRTLIPPPPNLEHIRDHSIIT